LLQNDVVLWQSENKKKEIIVQNITFCQSTKDLTIKMKGSRWLPFIFCINFAAVNKQSVTKIVKR
jgi:hypothetical protein